MHPVGTQVLLVGPTSPVGRELLLRLAVVGFEVVAYMPDGDDGRTGEFACRLAHDSGEIAAVAAAGGVVIRADVMDACGPAVTVTVHDVVRRFGHAPTIRAVVDRIRNAEWRDWWRDPWHGHAMPLVHERDVATVVAEALLHERPEGDIGGPAPLTWRDIIGAVFEADQRAPLWRPMLGRWAAPEFPQATLTAMAGYPRIGRRTLADVLTRRESAALHPVAGLATGAPSTNHS